MPDLKDLYKAAGVSAGVNAASGIASSALGFVFNKALMKQQNKYAKEMFELQNKRQDWLLQNSVAMQKRALQNAGYSTADPNGTGFSPAPVGNAAAPTNPAMDAASLGRLDLVQARLVAAQAANLEADTEKKKSETEGQDIQNWLNSTYGEKQIQAALANLDANTKKQVEEGLYTAQKKLNETALTQAQISDIEERLDMSWEKLPLELQLMSAEAYKAQSEGDLSQARIHEVYQNIRESAQRINLMASQIGLNDAQVGVAIQLAGKYAQEIKTEGWKTVEAGVAAKRSQFEMDVQTSMGLRYYQAKKVVDAVLPIGTVGALLGKGFGLGK